MTQKGNALNAADFLSESLETRRQWGKILLKQENRNCHSSISYPAGIKRKFQMKKINRMCVSSADCSTRHSEGVSLES